MFFKRFSQQAKETAAIEPISQKPVYILGESPLALFLAAKFKQSGCNAVLLNAKAPATSYKNFDFTLKEEYNLQKNNFSIPATSRISAEPQLIIVASEHYSLKSNLSLLPGKSYPNTPLICFNYIENPDIIRPLLGSKTTQAYFKGFLELDKVALTAFGSMPQITLTTAKDGQETENLAKILQSPDIKVAGNNNDSLNFWENFAPFIIGYLSSAPRQHISDILNNKESKNTIFSAATEICRLAAFEKIQLSENDLLRQLLETPHNFYFRKSRRLRAHDAAELDAYYSLIANKAQTYKCKIPQIGQLMKNNYNQLLKK